MARKLGWLIGLIFFAIGFAALVEVIQAFVYFQAPDGD